jgi:CheY-like chemotaxis protein
VTEWYQPGQRNGWFACEGDSIRSAPVVMTGQGAGRARQQQEEGTVPRALCVDDDRLIRHFLSEALTRGGYDVVTAADGAAAIRLLDSHPGFDLVVTDYAMPAVDELIRERGRQFDPDCVDAFIAILARPGDYDDVVDSVSELNLISERAHAPALRRSMVGGPAR